MGQGLAAPGCASSRRGFPRRSRAPAALGNTASSLAFSKWSFCQTALLQFSRCDPQPFRVLLLRRLWLQLPSSSRSWRCGRPLDSCGHHRAASAVAGVLSRKESAAVRVCREAGGRVSSNVRVQDMDLAAPDRLDNRRIEVVVDGLPLVPGAQLAVDTTLVSPLRRDGTPHPRCAEISGAALTAARRRKEATYPELHGRNGRTRLVVLGAEVGGRWSDESAAFDRHWAKAKARGEPPVLRGRAQQAWMHHWSSLLACSAAKALRCRCWSVGVDRVRTVRREPPLK